jgi:PKHD-type hydroxylase
MATKFEYVYFKDFLNKEKCENLNKFIENNFDFFEPKDWGAKDSNNNYKKTSTVKIIKWKKIKQQLQDLEQQIMFCNSREFGYDINSQFDESNCFYNIYSSDNSSNYDWHQDISNFHLTDTKLTVLLNLSTDDYEGGELELNYSGNPITIKEFTKYGDIVLFKSHILHRVLPIKKGTRKTLALFFEGPNFK